MGYGPWGHKELHTTERLMLYLESNILCASDLAASISVVMG